MIQVAIVEDDIVERKRICECLNYLESSENLKFHTTEFSTGASFLDKYEPGEYGIVFMDIEMPGINGMDTAKALRKMDGSVALIFVTNLAQFAIDGYEVDAIDFILKPINKYSFAIKVKRAVNRLPQKTEDFISVKTEKEMVSVRVSSVKYLEVDGHYVIYHTADGTFSEYTTMKDAYGKLNRSYFVFANRSALVNLHYVTSVTKDSVYVGEARIDISRPQRKPFLSSMAEFMGGKL